MKLDLKALFGGDTQRIAIEEQLDFHDLQYGSYCPLRQPVCCTSRSSNTPKKKESATASSRPAIPCQPKQPKNCHSSWPET